MKKPVFFGAIVVVAACLWFANVHTAQAVDGKDSFERVPANCVGVTSTAEHRCEFIQTQVKVGDDLNPFDQWNLIMVEPGIVTDVSCQMAGTHIFEFRGSNGPKRNPFPGEHYGNVGICRGWINGGVGPVTMTVTYGLTKNTKK